MNLLLKYIDNNYLEVSPRGYEPTGSSGRHSRALASGNWRVSEGDDDGGGWVTSRGSERSDRWRSKSYIVHKLCTNAQVVTSLFTSCVTTCQQLVERSTFLQICGAGII